eukprot:scaffold53859_cov30-Phaeocystis_antarctica.AAC.1
MHPAPRGLAGSLTRAPESRRSVLGRKARPRNHQERGRERRARKRMRWACGRLLIERVRSAATPRTESHAAPSLIYFLARAPLSGNQ